MLLVVLFEAEETWRWRGSENRPESRFGIVRFVRRAVGGLLAIVTLRRWTRRRRSKSDPGPMASEDVARRLGFGEAAGPVLMAPQRIVVSGPRRVEMDQPPAAIPPDPLERGSRVRLLRDTVGATLVLAGFVIVAVNVVIPPQSTPQPSGQVEAATAFATVIVTPAPTASPTAAPIGLASIVPEPSLLGEALVSAEPTPTSTPTAAPAPRKTQAPPPTQAPTQPPTATPKPTPKPTPRPAASITSFGADNLSPAVDQLVTFTFSYRNAESFTIYYSDGGSDGWNLGGSGSTSTTHQFASESSGKTLAVVITAQGVGGDSPPKSLNIHVQ